jgi:hypothetical protein
LSVISVMQLRQTDSYPSASSYVLSGSRGLYMQVGLNQRCLAHYGLRDGEHSLNFYVWDNRPLRGERLFHEAFDSLIIYLATYASQEYVQAIDFLHDLPAAHRSGVRAKAEAIKVAHSPLLNMDTAIRPLLPEVALITYRSRNRGSEVLS